MAKVVMICGRICTGKSTYAQKLRREMGAVVLSVDEITLALFGRDAGEKHDDYVARTERHLFGKAVEIAEVGVDVILDWGFWTRQERDDAKAFFAARGIACELHVIDVADEVWHARIDKRNADILAGKTDAYYVDEGLATKFGAIFEMPGRDEADVWVKK